MLSLLLYDSGTEDGIVNWALFWEAVMSNPAAKVCPSAYGRNCLRRTPQSSVAESCIVFGAGRNAETLPRHDFLEHCLSLSTLLTEIVRIGIDV